MEKYQINIAKDFSDTLGGRFKKLGPSSGEEFYEEILEKKFLLAKDKKEKLHVYLDGAKGYGSSFLDESFGKLAREYGVDIVLETIVFHTENFKRNVKYIQEMIWDINND
ncbi:DUF4325 domain-containing protein [Marinilabiliaceae bacterium JC040]|nr:DUF4325 domain-containing protein [Marinilabiliaceae bacterium JC040]